jgi:HAD superfamily hydrolase (TIGR01662 family)
VSDDILERYQLLIFDADDTLRRTTVPGKPCPHDRSEWELMPGVWETLSRISWRSLGAPKFGLASNQDQIAYGYLTIAMARGLLRDLALAVTSTAPPEEALQLCPHPLSLRCRCRKPEPGMLLSIMEFYGIKPAATAFIGNHKVDQEAAERAGIDFIWSEDLFSVPQT